MASILISGFQTSNWIVKQHDFRGDLTDIPDATKQLQMMRTASCRSVMASMLISGFKTSIWMAKLNNFRGDLTDTLDTKKQLQKMRTASCRSVMASILTSGLLTQRCIKRAPSGHSVQSTSCNREPTVEPVSPAMTWSWVIAFPVSCMCPGSVIGRRMAPFSLHTSNPKPLRYWNSARSALRAPAGTCTFTAQSLFVDAYYYLQISWHCCLNVTHCLRHTLCTSYTTLFKRIKQHHSGILWHCTHVPVNATHKLSIWPDCVSHYYYALSVSAAVFKINSIFLPAVSEPNRKRIFMLHVYCISLRHKSFQRSYKLSNVRSCVESPYDIQCLIRK